MGLTIQRMAAATPSSFFDTMDQAPVTKAIFLDEVDILVTAGRGGDGCVSFRREKFVPKGGPDGGDGGNGGSVYIVADQSLNTLQHLAGHHHWKADKGGHGSGKTRHGRSGEDLFIRVPVGTIIYDSMHGIVLKDLVEEGQKTCIAHGGHGRRGNTAFKTSVHQAPGRPSRGNRARNASSIWSSSSSPTPA